MLYNTIYTYIYIYAIHHMLSTAKPFDKHTYSSVRVYVCIYTYISAIHHILSTAEPFHNTYIVVDCVLGGSDGQHHNQREGRGNGVQRRDLRNHLLCSSEPQRFSNSSSGRSRLRVLSYDLGTARASADGEQVRKRARRGVYCRASEPGLRVA